MNEYSSLIVGAVTGALAFAGVMIHMKWKERTVKRNLQQKFDFAKSDKDLRTGEPVGHR